MNGNFSPNPPNPLTPPPKQVNICSRVAGTPNKFNRYNKFTTKFTIFTKKLPPLPPSTQVNIRSRMAGILQQDRSEAAEDEFLRGAEGGEEGE